jgi:hypothetical protein
MNVFSSYSEHTRNSNAERRNSGGYFICTPPEFVHKRIATSVELELALRAKRSIEPGMGYNAAWWTETETSPVVATPFNVYTFTEAGARPEEVEYIKTEKLNQGKLKLPTNICSDVHITGLRFDFF